MHGKDLQAWVAWRTQQLRVELDLTQDELATMAGLSENAIAMLEGMKREPLISTVGNVIAGFGMSPAEFFAPLDKRWEPVQPRPPRKKGRRGPCGDVPPPPF